MHKEKAAALLLAGTIGLAGCSSSADAAKNTGSASPSPSASSSAPTTAAPATPATPTPVPTTPAQTATAPAPAPAPVPADPAAAVSIAEQLQALVPSITAVTEVTAANDTSGSWGQPGQYTSAAWITDAAATVPENSVVGGAVVEVFATEADAQARFTQLQEHFALGAAYKREYMYLRGTALLRVTGKVGDQQAALYEQAFNGLALG